MLRGGQETRARMHVLSAGETPEILKGIIPAAQLPDFLGGTLTEIVMTGPDAAGTDVATTPWFDAVDAYIDAQVDPPPTPTHLSVLSCAYAAITSGACSDALPLVPYLWCLTSDPQHTSTSSQAKLRSLESGGGGGGGRDSLSCSPLVLSSPLR